MMREVGKTPSIIQVHVFILDVMASLHHESLRTWLKDVSSNSSELAAKKAM